MTIEKTCKPCEDHELKTTLQTPWNPSWKLESDFKVSTPHSQEHVKGINFVNSANLDTELILEPECSESCNVNW